MLICKCSKDYFHMKSIVNLVITIISSSFCMILSAQENPFLKMTKEPYSHYCDILEEELYKDIELRDSVWAAQTAAQMREAAKISKNKKWLLEADYFEVTYRFFRSEYLNLIKLKPLDSLVVTYYIGTLRQIIHHAKKIKASDIELRAIYSIWKCYYDYVKDYEKSFTCGLELDKALATVSAAEFPHKIHYYTQIGTLYYNFNEYEMAKSFFEKGLELQSFDLNFGLTRGLWNNMGLIYRNHYKDLEKSDSCFLKIFETAPQNPEQAYPSYMETKQNAYNLWCYIAKGNLGYNYYLRGDYENAIPLLKTAAEKTVENNSYNYPYAAGKALTLSEIFLITNDKNQAKKYADMAYEFICLNDNLKRDTHLLMQYYQIMSRYHRLLGNNAKALLYSDSAATARAKYEHDFNLRKLLYANQLAQRQKLDAEILRSKTYLRNLIAIGVFVFILIALLILLYYFYRQKRAAYRALVLKTQQWAQTPFVPDKDKELQENNANDNPNENDLEIFERLNLLMVEKKIFLNTVITLDQIAQLMEVNRTYLSRAVNNCTSDNFNTFINEFRVKEAVLFMSKKESQKFSIEGIALEAGFNDRKTFYRAFKKSTGFSPATFRSNLGSTVNS